MTIETAILDFLRKHDMLPLGEHGALIRHDLPANAEDSGRAMQPPTSRLQFHASIRHAHSASWNAYLAECGLSVEAYESWLGQVAQVASANLSSVEIASIGKFELGTDAKLSFIPQEDFFHTGNFGLSAVALHLVDNSIKKKDKYLQRHTATKGASDSSSWWNRKRKVAVASAGVAAIAILSTIALVFNAEKPSSAELAKVEIPTNQPTQDSEASLIPSLSGNEQAPSVEKSEPPVQHITPAPKAEKIKPAISSKASIVETPTNQFHIAIGAFQSPDNAQLLVSSLGKKGKSAQILRVNETLYRVVVESHSDSVQVQSKLPSVKKSIRSDAWVVSW